MLIELHEAELRKVADPADVDELLKGIATEQRLQETASKTKRRLAELDGIIAAPKPQHAETPWQSALQGADGYGGDPRKEAVEEHQFLTDNLSFVETALKEARTPLVTLLNRVSEPFCERERPFIVREIQTAVDCFQQGKAALARATGRREKLDDMGVKTAAIPVFIAPRIIEHIELYFQWIKANFPEVKLP